MTGGPVAGGSVRFREQARSAYSRDFGARTMADPEDPDDDLDQRIRVSPWPVVAAMAAIAALLALGLGVQVSISVVVTPVSFVDGQLVAVPAEGATPGELVGAPAEIRVAGRPSQARVTAETEWRTGKQRIPAVLLTADRGLGDVRPEEVTAVVLVGEQSLVTDLFSGDTP